MGGLATTDSVDAVRIERLAKRYGDAVALDGLDLRVARGCMFGLLGPNGAGKTSAVSILTTLARATSGNAWLLGHDVALEPAAVRASLGIVFQEASLDPELTGREHLDLQARLYHLPDRRPRVAEMLALAGLEDRADRIVRTYSGGMRRRLEIARGLLHRPPVLFLDEPTLGLDVRARARIWEHIRILHREEGTTVFLTTHSMEEADRLCERVAVIDRGRCVVTGTPAELKADLGGDVIGLVVERPEDARRALEATPWVRNPEIDGPRIRIALRDAAQRLPALVDALRDSGIVELTLHRPTLEDVFLHHTGHSFEPDSASE